MRVIIGHDERTPRATEVALKTLRETSGIEGEILDVAKLRDHGLFWRTEDTRPTGLQGPARRYDFASQADCSTAFANARFLTPMLGGGYTLFVDSDVVFVGDVQAMAIDPDFAVSVVKHSLADPKPYARKMDDQAQRTYSRKNWSSVMLFNCDHPSNRRLSLWDVNNRPGRDLHRFCWLHDDEIGSLSPQWNWLVGVQPMPEDLSPGIAHFTLGGPFIDGWNGAEHDDIWLEAAK